MKHFKAVTLLATTLMGIASLSLSHEQKVPANIDDPVSLRINMMKNVGASTGILGAMVKGEADFNATSALAALMAINSTALGLTSMFPEGFESSLESTSAPAIWQNPTGFNDAVAKFIADTTAAVAAKPADLDTLRTVFGSVTGNCRSCHEDFRLRHQ